MKLNGITYNSNNVRLVNVLEFLRTSDTRVTITYGDQKTGRFWGDQDGGVDAVTGYVRNSSGDVKVPIILHNKTSKGGRAILDPCIVQIDYANKDDGGCLFHVRDIPAEQPDVIVKTDIVEKTAPDPIFGMPVIDATKPPYKEILKRSRAKTKTKTKKVVKKIEPDQRDPAPSWSGILNPVMGPDG